jgi:hypothetical protein
MRARGGAAVAMLQLRSVATPAAAPRLEPRPAPPFGPRPEAHDSQHSAPGLAAAAPPADAAPAAAAVLPPQAGPRGRPPSEASPVPENGQPAGTRDDGGLGAWEGGPAGGVEVAGASEGRLAMLAGDNQGEPNALACADKLEALKREFRQLYESTVNGPALSAACGRDAACAPAGGGASAPNADCPSPRGDNGRADAAWAAEVGRTPACTPAKADRDSTPQSWSRQVMTLPAVHGLDVRARTAIDPQFVEAHLGCGARRRTRLARRRRLEMRSAARQWQPTAGQPAAAAPARPARRQGGAARCCSWGGASARRWSRRQSDRRARAARPTSWTSLRSSRPKVRLQWMTDPCGPRPTSLRLLLPSKSRQ